MSRIIAEKIRSLSTEREIEIDDILDVGKLIAIDGGQLYKGSNGIFVKVGDEIPDGTTHITILTAQGVELMRIYKGELPAFVNAITKNEYKGFDLNEGSIEVVSNKTYELRSKGDFRGWGGKVGKSADSSASIIKGLSDNNYVQVSGVVRADQMIILGEKKHLHINANSEILRTTDTDNPFPVVWGAGPRCALTGESFSSSVVATDNDAPNGVVLFGHWSDEESSNNVVYPSFNKVNVRGQKAFGKIKENPLDKPDQGVMVRGSQVNGNVMYFLDINNILIESVNNGLQLRGWANACTGGNIHGFRIGNDSFPDDRTFVWFNGALDCAMSRFFFHQSNNSHALKFTSLTTSIRTFTPDYNDVTGFVAEQGGAQARGLIAEAGARNNIAIRSNVAGGDIISSLFAKFNTISLLSGMVMPNLTAQGLKSKSGEIGEFKQMSDNEEEVILKSKASSILTQEDKVFKVAEIVLTQDSMVTLTISAITRAPSLVIGKSGSCKITYEIKRGASGFIESKVISNNFYSGAIPKNVINMGGNVAAIAFQMPSNGGSSNCKMSFKVDMVSTVSTTILNVFDEAIEVEGAINAPVSPMPS